MSGDRPVVMITGAAGGVGALLVERFVTLGHEVVAVDLAFSAPPSRGVQQVRLDLSDEQAVVAACAGLRDAGTVIGVLVNCAALFGDFRPTHRLDTETWDAYMAVNVRGPFLLMREVLPAMVSRRFGRIVNVSSISSTLGGYRQAHYAASKAALIGLANTVAVEYGPAGVTCNCVLPGVIDGPQLALAPRDVSEGALQTIPARRFAQPDEIVAAVEFLADPRSGYVNGVSIPVDGGSSLLQLKFSRDITFDPHPG